MLGTAMFLNPGGPPWSLVALGIAIVGIGIGVLWIWRIASMGEDPNRSFSRLNRRRSGTRMPSIPALHRHPTAGWLLTRGAIAIGGGSIVAAVAAPLVIRRWDHALELGPVAMIVWLAAIAAAVIGTIWMTWIALRTPEDGRRTWRYRR